MQDFSGFREHSLPSPFGIRAKHFVLDSPKPVNFSTSGQLGASPCTMHGTAVSRAKVLKIRGRRKIQARGRWKLRWKIHRRTSPQARSPCPKSDETRRRRSEKGLLCENAVVFKLRQENAVLAATKSPRESAPTTVSTCNFTRVLWLFRTLSIVQIGLGSIVDGIKKTEPQSGTAWTFPRALKAQHTVFG